MLFRTHLIFTLFVVCLIFPFLTNPLNFLIISLVGSIFPDIDSSNSFINKFKPLKIINLFSKHRGLFHSLIGLFLFSSIFLIFFHKFFFAFILGYSLHLFLDSLTLRGVYLFYPFNFRFKGFIKTGGVIETTLFFICLFSCFFILIYHLFIII